MLPALKDFDHLTDVTFIVDGKKYNLHKCILMSRSKWFEGMLSHNFKEKVSNIFILLFIYIYIYLYLLLL